MVTFRDCRCIPNSVEQFVVFFLNYKTTIKSFTLNLNLYFLFYLVNQSTLNVSTTHKTGKFFLGKSCGTVYYAVKCANCHTNPACCSKSLLFFLVAPSSAQGKQTGSQSSSAPVNVIIPVVIALILVAALVAVYCIRRKRLERRVRKRLGQSQTELVNNADSSYHDLNSQEYDSTEELQEIFPVG